MYTGWTSNHLRTLCLPIFRQYQGKKMGQRAIPPLIFTQEPRFWVLDFHLASFLVTHPSHKIKHRPQMPHLYSITLSLPVTADWVKDKNLTQTRPSRFSARGIQMWLSLSDHLTEDSDVILSQALLEDRVWGLKEEEESVKANSYLEIKFKKRLGIVKLNQWTFSNALF